MSATAISTKLKCIAYMVHLCAQFEPHCDPDISRGYFSAQNKADDSLKVSSACDLTVTERNGAGLK